MSTKKYAVIGHPIGHTMSPFIHTKLFELAGIDAVYTKLDVAPESLGYEYDHILSKLSGYNITIPHKQNIIQYLDEIDEKANMYGSVNTVDNRDYTAKGYTTDPDGFLKALDAAKIKLNGRVVILGCGGVARTMAYEVVLKNIPVLFAVRLEDVEIAKKLCEEINSTVIGSQPSYCLISELNGDIDVLINATPIGMFPNVENQPVSDEVIAKCKNVFDAAVHCLKRNQNRNQVPYCFSHKPYRILHRSHQSVRQEYRKPPLRHGFRKNHNIRFCLFLRLDFL